MKIITNNQYRDLLNSWDLTKKELKEFDYMTQDTLEEKQFIRYRKSVYCISDFSMIIQKGMQGFPFAHYDYTGDLKGWNGILTDSFFSDIVIAYNKEFDQVKIGCALS